MDAELTRHYKSLQVRARNNRKHYVKRLVLVWIIVATIVLITWTGEVYHNTLLYLVFLLISFLAGIVAFLLSVPAVSWILVPLTRIDSAFVRTYRALETLEISRKDDATTPTSADENIEVEQEAKSLLQSALKELDTDFARDDLRKEANDLVDAVIEDIGTRILPAAEEGTLAPDILAKLAKAIETPTIDSLKAFRAEAEATYPAKKEAEVKLSVGQNIDHLLATRRGQIMLAFLGGFSITMFASVLIAVGSAQDPSALIRTNSLGILGVGAVISVGLLQFMKK